MHTYSSKEVFSTIQETPFNPLHFICKMVYLSDDIEVRNKEKENLEEQQKFCHVLIIGHFPYIFKLEVGGTIII